MDKLGSPESLFSIQVLVRASSSAPGIAKAQVQAILASFDTFAGDNHFRACGLRIPAVAFPGSDLPGRRQDFDGRVACGLFRPRRRRVVTASEIASLLKPPSVKCAAPNVLRSGGAVPPAPAKLPTFAGQPSLLPLGLVGSESGERMVGVPLADTARWASPPRRACTSTACFRPGSSMSCICRTASFARCSASSPACARRGSL